jgi:8-oxo-dGTP pyrophosphatase MutT (NUDIX family)
VTKDRAGVVIVRNGRLALIERHRDDQHYFAVPGGGIERGESVAEAAQREAEEELGVPVTLGSLRVSINHREEDGTFQQQWYYDAFVDRDDIVVAGPELDNHPSKGTYEAVWVPLDELVGKRILPQAVADLAAANGGVWPDALIEIDESKPRITTAHGSEMEVRTAEFLRQLLDRYDVARWQFTDQVVIDEDAIPHSHPVLTLSTRVRGRSLTGLLATYLHEQLHWYVNEEADPNAVAAMAACRELSPEVPADFDGARDAKSVYLHFLVVWLEFASLRKVAPGDETEAFIASCAESNVYAWISRQCIERSDEIEAIVRAHGFDAILR